MPGFLPPFADRFSSSLDVKNVIGPPSVFNLELLKISALRLDND
jgi:hypothetical protein